jgi:type VI secretion system protein ImpH
VRFRPALDFSFGATEVDSVAWDAKHERHEVTTRFLSLYGAGSPLPACYTELLLYEDPEGRLRSFLDIFNHRLVSFLFRAWEKYRYHVVRDAECADPVSRRSRLLCHLERKDDPVDLLAFAGLLQRQPLSEASVERLLEAYLQVPVAVYSCVVRWLPVPDHQLMALGSRNCVLGGLAVLGRELRSASTTYRVHVGPLSYEKYVEFLPGGTARTKLLALLDRLDADALDCELTLEVDANTLHTYCLGSPEGGLGFTSWIGVAASEFAPAVGATVSRILIRPNSKSRVA